MSFKKTMTFKESNINLLKKSKTLTNINNNCISLNKSDKYNFKDKVYSLFNLVNIVKSKNR